jgi:hypothetical protein
MKRSKICRYGKGGPMFSTKIPHFPDMGVGGDFEGYPQMGVVEYPQTVVVENRKVG